MQNMHQTRKREKRKQLCTLPTADVSKSCRAHRKPTQTDAKDHMRCCCCCCLYRGALALPAELECDAGELRNINAVLHCHQFYCANIQCNIFIKPNSSISCDVLKTYSLLVCGEKHRDLPVMKTLL